ncbi:TonB-dependent receptor plug domain-containing protein [Vitreimonas sp.]|uniref:TonB-dependent receptor plug domain-containing protein n=1 Tax=Vitreimonas sp. TaxID=3069702 RepID=UPI002EDA2430
MGFRTKFALALGVASAALTLGAGAQAQQASEQEVTTAQDIVVLGNIQYRNRVDGAPPVLEYDTEYFQRFEPLTVGDALKRVPSVAFLSDVLESDGVRLRGLDPAYTQILINGEQVPGSGDSSGAFGNGADGSFFVDRIPAELIDRVEIVRSQSANRSGDAVAGAINIILRDAYNLDGGYIRGGVMNWQNDGNWGETLGGVWGGEVGGGRLLIGANMQDRHNPKDKLSLRYDEPGGTLDNSEVQTDVRDGTDYSANFSYQREFGAIDARIDGFYVHTDRFQNEDSIEYADGVVDALNIQTINNNDVDIEQDSYSLNGRLDFDMFGGETRVKLGYASFTNDSYEFEDEVEFLRDANPYPEGDRFTRDSTLTSLEDSEFKFKLEHERDLGAFDIEFGVHYESKERENLVQETPRIRFNLAGGTVVNGSAPDDSLIPAFGAFAPVPGGDNTIERERIDPFVMVSGDVGSVDWEAGLRYETTEVTIDDRTTGTSNNSSYEILLPSAHVSWHLTDNDRILASVARTVRNPSFTFLSPATLEEELGDSDFVGVVDLEPETAWGLDIGYERRLGRTGIVGVNYFYRDVSDLIEIYNTGVVGSAGAGTWVYSARNTGDGSVWGVEFDLSTSLAAIGLDDTGVFFNYSWLDSEVDDELGSRRFNDQAESIFNVGFIQDLPSWNSSFGVTYRDQGSAFSRVVAEEVTTEYGADLEMFIEHRFGSNFTVRLTGSNLLDESKDEFFDKFENLADQVARDYDEYEVESESAGPVFQLVGRYAF